MSVIAFLSEPYSKTNDGFVSQKASVNFIKSCFDDDVIVAGRLVKGGVESPSAYVSQDLFEELPNYDSIVDFFVKAIKDPFFIKKYIKRCFNILDKYPEADIWVRNPSIGCLIFSYCALKRNRKLYNHMCANAMRAWDGPKYTGFLKVIAYVFSRVLKSLVVSVVKDSRVVNLCTGDELYSFCKSLNANSYMLIDSNIKSINDKPIENNIKVFKFVFVGRVQEDKGIVELLTAFCKLQGPFCLEVIGDGPLRLELQKRFDLPNIDFVGQVQNDKLSSYFKEANALIVPSKNRYEGFPRVILEAWSNTVPVIASEVGGVKAFVEDDYNGYLFDISNSNQLYHAMKRISDSNNYKRIMENCRNMHEITLEEYWVNKFKNIRKLQK
ncbi:glycosyltransferase family 4 protein [Vibrio parahaemolyticus]|uniref:glycosyltransferase family 4 protein n=1 Tax=Vibrio parahaemolyticus TaxID=670 RepID=UPI001D161951|nr:glycosyltransferase [Vibrio parahaemolyticus]ELB2036798.1 glycosyltransferase [Vibrio parahaemolyticus]MCC3813489.1 glycosyltransferase [Vibrio parahaemolyticus]